MSELILEVTESSLDLDVLAAPGPVLLDLWAPWCAPCRALAPVLKKLSGEYQGDLQIAKLDVEKYPEVQRRFGVRGIPTMILFREGVEAARATGSKSAEEIRRWLSREGVQLPADVPVQSSVKQDGPSWGAFYGDAELRDFLVARLKARAAAGLLKDSRMPFWIDGKGTISAAMVGSAEPRIFEGITGMPASFACVLELCVQGDPRPELVDSLLGSIPLGANLCDVAPHMMLALFDGGMGDWSAILADEQLDALRRRWLTLSSQELAGQQVKREAWNTLLVELEALRSKDREPERGVHDGLISTLAALSPLPYADDGASWSRAMLLSGKYLLHVLAASRLGWKEEEFGFERFRDAWFTERQKQEHGGEFNREALAVAHEEWMREHGERQRNYDTFFETHEANMAPVIAKIRDRLAGLLVRAPILDAA